MVRPKSINEILSSAEKPGGIERNFQKKTLIPMKGSEWMQNLSEYIFNLEAENLRLRKIIEERDLDS